MTNIIKLISDLTAWFWGWPILIVLIGGGVLLSVRMGFVQ